MRQVVERLILDKVNLSWFIVQYQLDLRNNTVWVSLPPSQIIMLTTVTMVYMYY